MDKNQQCFYVPGQINLIDLCNLDAFGNYRGHYSQEILGEVLARHPSAVRMAFDDAMIDIEKAQAAEFVTAPVEIDEARFVEMLEVLPPQDWQRHHNAETFKISEYTF